MASHNELELEKRKSTDDSSESLGRCFAASLCNVRRFHSLLRRNGAFSCCDIVWTPMQALNPEANTQDLTGPALNPKVLQPEV